MISHLKNIFSTATVTILLGCYGNPLAFAKVFPVMKEANGAKILLYAKEPISSPVAVVRSQLDALNREDLNAAMNALHPSSPGFQQTKAITAELFNIYDIRYTFKKITLESGTNDLAKVRFSQISKKIAGPQFRNNRIDGVHILKKYNGQWKIYDTQTIKIEFLNQ
jgi:hypothetical protein